jgi:hypothetical protein
MTFIDFSQLYRYTNYKFTNAKKVTVYFNIAKILIIQKNTASSRWQFNIKL